jgi:hypothetical protein
MKIKILLCAALVLAAIESKAQLDSTYRTFRQGMAIYAEFGLLPNNKSMRNQLERLNIDPFTSIMGSIVLARRMDAQKWFSEGRIILMNSTNYTKDKDVRKAYLGGIGLGVDGGPKLVNNTRWNVMIPIGVDVMFYRLKIKNNGSARLSQIVQNPGAYQPVKLFTRNINAHAGIGVDYKLNTKSRINDAVYISGKATYHLPVLGRRDWKSEDVTVSDLSKLKLNQVYLQLGLVFFPKNNGKKGHWMH